MLATRYSKEDYLEGRFYQMPEALFQGTYHEVLGNDAKVLYSLLKSRHSLSIQNEWIDKDGNVYLIYTRQDMEKMLKVSSPTLRKAIKELTDCELMEEIRQGVNKANLIYINKPQPQYFAQEVNQEVEQEKQDEPNKIEECKKLTLQETSGVKESYSPECKKLTLQESSGVKESYSQECKNFTPSYIDNSYIKNKSNPILSCDQIREIRKDFENQIAYDMIKDNLVKEKRNTNTLDGIISVAVEVLASNKNTIVVSKENKDSEIVKEKFGQLKMDHIVYVMNCLENTNTELRNPQAVIRTSLYNAISSIHIHAANQSRSKNSFNDFEQREYDYEKLEKELLSYRP